MREVVAEIAAAHGARGGCGDHDRRSRRRGDGDATPGTRGSASWAGISILGTTGIVHPYSCSAWIASIHRGIDVCRANGVEHAAACTGSTSEAAVRRLYDLPDIALIDMGDFAGGTLKYLRRHPIAAPHHRRRLRQARQARRRGHGSPFRPQRGRPRAACRSASAASAPTPELAMAARSANTASEILGLAQAAGLPLGDLDRRPRRATRRWPWSTARSPSRSSSSIAAAGSAGRAGF